MQNIDFSALLKLQYGVYIVTTKCEDHCNGQIATAVFQITADPIKIAVCLAKDTYTHELIEQSKIIGISVLAQTATLPFIAKFGFKCGRSCDKLHDVNYKVGLLGCPLVTDNSLVVMEGNVVDALDVNSHTLYVVELNLVEKISDGIALTYEYYHDVIKGKSPSNAPTFTVNTKNT